MPALIPLFVSGAADKLAAFAVKCLAVAGGFMVGYVIGAAVVFALNRWVFAEKAPDVVKKSVRVLAGVAVALLVALIVFGDGPGGGLFGGGPGGDGKGGAPETPADKKGETPPKADPKKPPEKVEMPKTPAVKSDAPQVKVTFLGGDAVAGDRFYLIDDDPTKRTLAEVQKAVTDKKNGTTEQVYLVVAFPKDPRQAADRNNPTVTAVTDWAEKAGVKVVSGEGTGSPR